ncbi:CapA family protein [Marinococcus halotolerans]|uniref:CapA family protein n=1 Tax=Marinococcus halotolerans TaxID=301092 RepID=UPI0003B7B27A|nr:CapA family protein [Marinococcus halotolerans]
MAKRLLNFKEKYLAYTKRQRRKAGKHAVLGIIICLVAMTLIRVVEPSAAESEYEQEQDTIFTSAMVGDMMTGRHVEEIAEQEGYDSLFQYAKPTLQAADYTTGNFENPIVANPDQTEPADKIINLSSKPGIIGGLEDAGFDSVNLANNHMMDYQYAGLNETLQAFQNSSINVVGAGANETEAHDYLLNTYNGMDVATLGVNDITYANMEQAGPNSPGILTSQDPSAYIDAVQRADANADLVIVNVHFGQEYDSTPTTRQRQMTEAIADAGADVIVGTHPHVLQSAEVYNDTFIMHSIGNFVFDQGWTRTRDSVIANYSLGADGTAHLEMQPFRVFEATPRPVESAFHRERIFRQLTKDTQNKDAIVENGEHLVFEADHSNVIDSMEQNSNQNNNQNSTQDQ